MKKKLVQILLFLGIVAGGIEASQIEKIVADAKRICQTEGSRLQDLISVLPGQGDVYNNPEKPQLPVNYVQHQPLSTVRGTFSSFLEDEYWHQYNNGALNSLYKKKIISLDTKDDADKTYQNYLDAYTERYNKKTEEITEQNLNMVKKDTTRSNLE